MQKPDGFLTWNPATVEIPQMPMIPPGEDPMSATISAVLPTMAAPLEANVAALQGKETMFNGKLGAATMAYQGADDSGQQGVMQIVQSLGQMAGQAGQMGQMAGAPGQMAGQMGSQFGMLMQPMMQAFQSAGHGGHAPSAGGQVPQGGPEMAGQGPAGVAGAPQQGRDGDNASAQPEPQPEAQRDDQTMAAPQAGPGEARHGLTPIPVPPPEQHRPDDGGDISRRL
ncbi:hypothetical protein AWC26_10695 [Mycobacterium shimoidei]|nr:hypothetical protein AWC26_10695 [Mycobacterium shimoidei]